MKKVININFQGRVIPIEETAYEELQNYTDSLRKYFAGEEGRDEIINDIENRIAELFAERLKNNPAGCVTDRDTLEIIAGIGRPEEFDSEEAHSTVSSKPSFSQAAAGPAVTEPRGSWYRNQNDKILGGVCSGLAHYLRIDPTIVRILFALITLGGFGSGFLLYIILWIVLPARGLNYTVRRRLYRNPDDKVIGGVCSGIASYFNIGVWIPRLIFTLPFFITILSNIFSRSFGPFHDFPDVVFGSFGGTLIVTYIILWIVIPFATTASEKLEMRGEKVDLESIKNTVQEELQGVKGRTEKFSSEFSARASAFGEEVKERAEAFAAETGPAARKAGGGLGHALGVLFKAFFLFIAGIIVFALFAGLMALIFSGIGIFPLKNFMLEGFWQHAAAWGTLILFLLVPLIAAIVWLVRRISNVKSKNNYLGYVFGTLWTFGWVSMITLAGLISRDFKRAGSVREQVSVNQPAGNRMMVELGESVGRYYPILWFDDNDNNDLPALSSDEDSMLLNTVRLKIARSRDDNYRAYAIKLSRGNSPLEAERTASRIHFPVTQVDSVLYLPKGFGISKESKFRNQQVVFVLEVPVGKAIRVDKAIDWYQWFNVNTGRSGINIDWNTDWDNSFNWSSNTWYIMTANGLEPMESEQKWPAEDEKGWDQEEKEDGKEYRYRRGKDTIDIKIKQQDTTVNIKLTTDVQGTENPDDIVSSVSAGPGRRRMKASIFAAIDLLKIGMR